MNPWSCACLISPPAPRSSHPASASEGRGQTSVRARSCPCGGGPLLPHFSSALLPLSRLSRNLFQGWMFSLTTSMYFSHPFLLLFETFLFLGSPTISVYIGESPAGSSPPCPLAAQAQGYGLKADRQQRTLEPPTTPMPQRRRPRSDSVA